MTVLLRLRQFHAILGVFVILAYLTGEWDAVHAWLGYGVALLVFIRLIFALSGAPQLGLFRYYPQFSGLKLGNAMTHPAISRTVLAGIAVCVIGATATGIAMDRGATFAAAEIHVVAQAQADDDRRGKTKDRPGKILEEVHEAFANTLMLLVCLHVAYLTLFKRPLVSFMLFLNRPGPNERGGTSKD